jgi:putative FmdB family regulatory protein
MPTYDYLCNTCGEKFEHFQSMSSPALTNHPGCKKGAGEVKRIISGGTGLIFKGSGFYLTDYKKTKTKKSGENKTDKKSTPNKKKSNVSKNKTRKSVE